MDSITDDDARALVPHRVAGYSHGPANSILRAEFRDVSENLPAGGWLATSQDLARFALAFAQGKLVKPATRELMVQRPLLKDGTPYLVNYLPGSGATIFYRVHPDCQGWSTEASVTTVGGASDIVTYRLDGRSFALFY